MFHWYKHNENKQKGVLSLYAAGARPSVRTSALHAKDFRVELPGGVVCSFEGPSPPFRNKVPIGVEPVSVQALSTKNRSYGHLGEDELMDPQALMMHRASHMAHRASCATSQGSCIRKMMYRALVYLARVS